MKPKVAATPVIKAAGSRVYLRAPTLGDAKEYVALQRASRKHLWNATPATFTLAQYRKNFKAWTSPGNIRFLICLVDDGRIVGDAALSQIFLGRLRSAYLGYAIGAPYSGKGYMQEGLQLVLRHAFRTLKLNRVEANIQPWNARSIALAQRLGFRLEGYSRRYLKIANAWRDHQRWALLAAEWKPSRKVPPPATPPVGDGIEIRDLQLHDIAALAVLRHQISIEGKFMIPEPAEVAARKDQFAEMIARTLADPLKKRILALERGRAVGFISGTRGDSERSRHGVHIAIGILQSHTGRGIGGRLIAALEDWAKNLGVQRLDLRVMVHNERAIALYLRCGFCIEGRSRGEYQVDGKLVDGYIMGKILD